jgi:hypothetical protein
MPAGLILGGVGEEARHSGAPSQEEFGNGRCLREPAAHSVIAQLNR